MQILERYRCEARAVTKLPVETEDFETPAIASTPAADFPGSISEIQPDNETAQKPPAASKRGLEEQGIAEVLDDRALRSKFGQSPLSTLSR